MPRHNLVLDEGCETTELLRPLASRTFHEFDSIGISADDIYVLGRRQFAKHINFVRQLVNTKVKIIYSNPFEGSETLYSIIRKLRCEDLLCEKKVLLISGGDFRIPCGYLRHDHFIDKVHQYEENLQAIAQADLIYTKVDKPYSFLFLNGRSRPHRKWMIEQLDNLGLLDQSLWSWLDPRFVDNNTLTVDQNGINVINRPRDIRLLPRQYEVPRYQTRVALEYSQNQYAMMNLFDNEWGAIYLNLDAYVDTYFSVVTETVHEKSYSFRTEKIWKPMAIGHPWVCVANAGFNRDLRHLGFKTFRGIIDESFDNIEDNQERLNRVLNVIIDICRAPREFLSAARDICKYNQEHMIHLQTQINQDFPTKFLKFLRDHQWMT